VDIEKQRQSGRRGGQKGGKAMVPKGYSMLPKKERIANAKRAAEARWNKNRPPAEQ
jgi:hypothetical protein